MISFCLSLSGATRCELIAPLELSKILPIIECLRALRAGA